MNFVKKLDGSMAMTTTIETTLAERGSNYGLFKSHADITMALKRVIEDTPAWSRMTDSQREALHMIAHKVGRICNGNPNYVDSWVDISGYATLVVKEFNNEPV